MKIKYLNFKKLSILSMLLIVFMFFSSFIFVGCVFVEKGIEIKTNVKFEILNENLRKSIETKENKDFLIEHILGGSKNKIFDKKLGDFLKKNKQTFWKKNWKRKNNTKISNIKILLKKPKIKYPFIEFEKIEVEFELKIDKKKEFKIKLFYLKEVSKYKIEKITEKKTEKIVYKIKEDEEKKLKYIGFFDVEIIKN